MRHERKADALGERRRIAILMVEDGLWPAEVARRLHVSRQSVSRWVRAYRREGAAGIRPRPRPGPRRRLGQLQEGQLVDLLLKGPRAFGYRTDLWTRRRVAEVIAREFGIDYHTDHISRVLARLGWTYQKPERQARERDQEAVDKWVAEDWPRIKKKPRGTVRPSASSTRRVSARSPSSGKRGRRGGSPRS